MEKKYELTDEEIEFDGYVTLYRIRALKDFGDVKAGDLGGFIEDEDNLSHENDCWIYNDAKACFFAKIFDSTKIFDNAQIAYNAKIYNNVKIYGGHIFGSTQIYGNVIIDNDSRIYGNTKIYDNSEACEQTMTDQNGDSSTEFDNPF
ncbi:hypothetical protein [Bartonella harrusi]|uniref:Phage related protein n=1 Tax=Bartonella harrusi TaxID=2961895 RepID=A0ABY5EXU8_9HYPH|nr:hypothetical protein [Bartonella harrusi]UTO28985.1 hypothetical protein NMK50_03120 [Bartonella harrusi]